jgi:hypothetical protein
MGESQKAGMLETFLNSKYFELQGKTTLSTHD